MTDELGRALAARGRRTLLRSRIRQVEMRAERYQRFSSEAAAAWQLARLQSAWRSAATSVPFYIEWRKQHDLPLHVPNLETFAQFPVIDKTILQQASDLVFAGAQGARAYSTGGSTSTPTRFPRGSRSEMAERYATGMIGRSWWGVRPGDRYVHLWGHSGEMGGGPGAILRRATRHGMNVAVGATRLNGYDLTTTTLSKQWRAICRADPDYIVGYTSSVVRLTEHAATLGHAWAGTRRLKMVQVSAETLSEPDAEFLHTFWGVPVITEYGAAELGAVAGSRSGTWPLQVFWDSVLVQLHEDAPVVSTLHQRLFPLFRYSIGDAAVAAEEVPGSVLRMARVLGRAQDVLDLPTRHGTPVQIHGLLIIHIMKRDPRVRTCQVQQHDKGLTVYLSGTLAEVDLPAIHADLIRQLRRENEMVEAEAVVLTKRDTPWLTRAGKQLPVIPRSVHVASQES